jgi:hypothetical protein
MEHRGRVVHHAKRVYSSAELLFLEPVADTVSKTRPYEEHLLARPYHKIRLFNINYRPELH